MDKVSRAQTARRAPLGEATRRINNSQHEQVAYQKRASSLQNPRSESRRGDGSRILSNKPSVNFEHYNDSQPRPHIPSTSSHAGSAAVNPRVSAIKDHPASNRDSQVSATSTNSEGNRIKKMVGPWILGKSLGEGASAKVRLARHAYTHQQAAIKIIHKVQAINTMAGSLADLDQLKKAKSGTDATRMPVGIEREVAIMRLVQHDHIVKLYDIWENRTEIYLVLELAEEGELFSYICKTKSGLPEEEAIKFFRQTLSAIDFCHSFNICHRDLKPENILLGKDGVVKIADFGMAALHQNAKDLLNTHCGSIHYAAPEIVQNKRYIGYAVDVWSLGIILYALLTAQLPFQCDDNHPNAHGILVRKITSGVIEFPGWVSPEARDLIQRMLRTDPQRRIQVDKIWSHRLVRKYENLDKFRQGKLPQAPKECQRISRSDVAQDVFCNLIPLWHKLSEQELMDRLVSPEPNQQKIFYGLLIKYRDAQLENYNPELEYSASDLHHHKRSKLVKTYSTCHFPPSDANGQKRPGGKFTVIGSRADSERSYDPFRESRPQHVDGYRNDHAKVTIYRSCDEDDEDDDDLPISHTSGQWSTTIGNSYSWVPGSSRLMVPSNRNYGASRSSISSTRSRSSSGHVRAGYKRGVSFSHLRKNSTSSVRRDEHGKKLPSCLTGRHSNHTEVTDDGGSVLRRKSITPASTRYIRSRKATATSSQPFPSARSGRGSVFWKEDVRQLSDSLAKDCDEAFNRHSAVSNDEDTVGGKPSQKRVSSARTNGTRKLSRDTLNSRPLPPPPRSSSVKHELREHRKKVEQRKFSNDGEESPSYLDNAMKHVERLMEPLSPLESRKGRRNLSAPVAPRRKTSAGPLPSISETGYEDISPRKYPEREQEGVATPVRGFRVASAPEPRDAHRSDCNDYARPRSYNNTYARDYMRDSIRIVDSSLASLSPVRPPGPLLIRKKKSQAAPSMSGALDSNKVNNSIDYQPSISGLRQQYNKGENYDGDSNHVRIDEDRSFGRQSPHDGNGAANSIVKKRSGWFKRGSKDGVEDYYSCSSVAIPQAHKSSSTTSTGILYDEPEANRPNSSDPAMDPAKKKTFSIAALFRKRAPKPEMTISTARDIYDDDTIGIEESMIQGQHHSQGGSNFSETRNRDVAPQRSWLAKLFHVKPPAEYICFAIGKRRARREVTKILAKDWTRYGIEDVQIDKHRDLLFGRVAAQNYLEIKEVSFAAKFLTVVEDGNRSQLSIVRFTQENGAATSFRRVVDTLHSVLALRHILVTDEVTIKRMIKTARAA